MLAGVCVQKVCREKEEKLVAHDVLRLQLKRLQDILTLRAGEAPPRTARSRGKACRLTVVSLSELRLL